MEPLGVGDLAPAPPAAREESVAQDGEQPGVEVAAPVEAVLGPPGALDRVLDEVVGKIAVPAQRDREGPQRRQEGDEVAPHVDIAGRRRIGRAQALELGRVRLHVGDRGGAPQRRRGSLERTAPGWRSGVGP
jgi:hypothetical protein